MNISSIQRRSFSPIQGLVAIGSVSPSRREKKANVLGDEQRCNRAGTNQAPQTVLQEPSTLGLSLLIIDPDVAVRDTCCQVGMGMGFDTYAASDLEQARSALENTVIDLVLLNATGHHIVDASLLQRARCGNPHASVVVLTSSASVEGATSAMRAGASDYLAKPFSLAQLLTTLTHSGQRSLAQIENIRVSDLLLSQHARGQLLGKTPVIDRLFRWIARASTSEHPVLISGEFGSGKRAAAQIIHDNGPLAETPLTILDCASLSSTELEAVVFGMSRDENGALGPAVSDRPSAVLFDEVGELSPRVQATLAHGLEQYRTTRLQGMVEPVKPPRMLATTSHDLERRVASGHFRKDLYLRLNMVNVAVPPLRERKEDISMITAYFLRKLSGTGAIKTLSYEAIAGMQLYDWPGNLRELESVLQQTCIMSDKPVLDIADFPTHITSLWGARRSVNEEAAELSRIAAVIQPMHIVERTVIFNALHVCNGDRVEAARRLEIGRTTLYRKLKEYGEHEPSRRDRAPLGITSAGERAEASGPSHHSAGLSNTTTRSHSSPTF